MARGTNGPGSSSTSSRTSLSVRSRTPRMYRSPRASSSAMVSALIIPRSATMQTRPMEKRWRRRSTTGTKLPVSAVLPGHISVHTGRRGYSKDHRPDLRQMILAVILDGDGRLVCTEMWPGNTADTGSLVPVVDRLRQRFSIGRVCIVADRGMISAETIAELEARGLFYILGVRERTDKLVRELVLDDPDPFVPLAITKRGKSVNYEAKAVALAGRRYIVCRNHEEAKKDAADRAAILAALERQLKKGDKALVGNGGYRRFLATTGEKGFVIDRAKAEQDARFDGVFVLRTNTDLAPLDVMLCYKQLTMVEQIFRTAKSLFATRPIVHKRRDDPRSPVMQLPRPRAEEGTGGPHSYTHLRAHETRHDLVCRLLLEKQKP